MDLLNINHWVCSNKVVLNARKTKIMVLGYKKKELEQILEQKCFSEVSVIKPLGIHLDNRLSWTPHISYLSKKITSTACMI